MIISPSSGCLLHRLISAGTTNATLIKGKQGTLLGLIITNSNAATRFVKFYNKASAPTVGTDTPVMTIAVTSQVGVGTPMPFTITFAPTGIDFTAGISYAITGAQADADTTAITAGDVVMNVTYL